ncbi:MAG: beta-ketoacyl-[acyl-carrier-protein] synthase family protein [Flavipsychrobacter sp.]|nr:beta-ketoacyl-[acyl-carrier-protein] synthase family protein [Flavipsychrobacter sp.]
MRHKAYIVNTGVITAIGNNTQQCKEGLASGKNAIGKPRFLQTHWQNEIPVAEVPLSNDELAALAGVSSGWPRTALLSAVAVKEAWQPYRESAQELRCGFFSANTVGGMDLTENVYKDFKETGTLSDIPSMVSHECGAITELVAGHFGIHDFVTTISTACSSSANSIMMAAQMIEAGMLDVAVAGGADCLSRFTLNGFNTLMILDRQQCQPFDNNRRGLNLGEGAGYVLMMSEKAAGQCNATPICSVSGYANANDAYHQTASSPDGIGNKLAMQQAMAQAGITPAEVSYINLHGTGTANNDSSEGKAIESVFAGQVPPASSTKSFTGHTLGASGGVEAVFSTIAIADGILFPNMRWQTQMEDISWKPVTEMRTGLDIRHVLSNSFGFGGNCSSLVFSKFNA